MRSVESNQSGELDFKRDPNGILGQFEGSILKVLEKVKEKNLSHADKKKVVRMVCIKNGSKLGLPPEHAQNAAMYFFRLINENPDEIHVLWKNLHELVILLQNEGNNENSDKIIEKIEYLFELNKGGLTFFWRLIHALVRGDLNIQEFMINSESIYYITIPDEEERRKNNTNEHRKRISTLIKDQVKGRIIEKPLPDLHESIKHFNDQDRAVLRKIIVFLQQDADLLVLSSEWKQIIQKYFDDVSGFLKESISKITLEGDRSGARKTRYAEYINHILSGYLSELLAYCLKMADKSEENLFAADTLLEPTLVNTNVLKNGTDEPEITVIVNRWKLLMKEIQTIVGDNATRFNIPVLKMPLSPVASPQTLAPKDDGILENNVQGLDPSEFAAPPSAPSLGQTAFYHPALSGELKAVTPVSLQAQTNNGAMKATIIGTPAIATESPAQKAGRELLEWSAEIDLPPKVMPRGNVVRKKNPDLNGTIMGLQAIDDSPKKPQQPHKSAKKEVDPLAPTCAMQRPETALSEGQKKPDNPQHPRMINYIDFFYSLSGADKEKAEEYIKNNINNEITDLKRQLNDGSLDLKTKSEIFLLNKLNKDIYLKYVLSDNLRKFFVSSCLRLYNETNEKEYIYSTLRVLFANILNRVVVPGNLGETFSKEDRGIPSFNDLQELTKLIPRLKDYPLLANQLSSDDPVLSEINRYAADMVKKLLNFSLYFESLVYIAEGGQDPTTDFMHYYENLKKEYEGLLSIIKDLRRKKLGGFLKRIFGNKGLNAEINQYFESLSNYIEWIWQTGIEPSLVVYGKLILGKHKIQIPGRKV